MALTTLAAIALGISAASGVATAVDARKNRKETAARLAQQKVEAREAAKLDAAREDTGAEVVLGSASEEDRRRKAADAPAARTATRPVGGLSASDRLGL